MNTTQNFIYSQDYPNGTQYSTGTFSYLIINADAIQFSGKVIPIDANKSSTISSVKSLLTDVLVTKANISDVLLFDLGLEYVDVRELIDFLHNNDQHRRLHVLWNPVHLSITDMQYLLQLHIVDDFIEDIHDLALVDKKLQFLMKYKQRLTSPKLLEIDALKSENESRLLMMFFKRFFDIAISSILLILLFPLFVFVGLAIKLESRGPIFYISKRVGKHYKVFPMIKFRSMRDGADQTLSEITHLNMYGSERNTSAFVKIKNDPRVSEVGKFLRKTSIDEFPQLLNVLLGHMSIVGNRPLPLYEAEKLLLNDYVSRFDAPAGITGLWQVIKKDRPNMDEYDRIQLDIKYAREFSLLNDLWILLKTPSALLQNQNY